MKELRTTLIFLVLLVGAGAWVYFYERGPAVNPGSTVLLRTQSAGVQSIALQHSNGRRITLVRHAQNWQVKQESVHPVEVPADDDQVQRILDAVQLVQSPAIVQVDGAKNAASYGLTGAGSMLLVDDARLEFGARPSFDPSKIYVRVTSSQTHQGQQASAIALVPVTLARFTEEPFDTWRDKNALHLPVEDVSDCEINTPSASVSLKRTQKATVEDELDRWDMAKPLVTRADAGTVVTFLQQLAMEKAISFVEDNPPSLGRWGLDKPLVTLTFTTPQGRQTLRIGKKLARGYAAQNSSSNAVFTVGKTVVGLSRRPLSAWRDKTVLRFMNSDLQSLVVKAGGKTAKFENTSTDENPNWQRQDGSGVDATAAQKVLDFGMALKNLYAMDFIDSPGVAATYGFDRPDLEFEVRDAGWPGAKTVQVGKKEGQLYARVGENGQFASPVYKLPPGALDNFRTPLKALFPEKAAKKKTSH